MFSQDIPFIFIWWFAFLLIGIVFLPFALFFFPHFKDRGYIFAKVLGVLLISYSIFLLGTFHILPFTDYGLYLLLFLFGGASIFLLFKYKAEQLLLLTRSWKLFAFEEALFFAAVVFWSFIRGHEPSVHGLEKYMDFGFVNSILRTDYFPAKDLWLSPLSINYYYFGHLFTAVVTKISGIDSVITFNLMIATLFAFTFCGSFSIGLNLIGLLAQKRSLIAGLLSGFLVAFAGNLHTIYAFFAAYDGEKPVPFWTLKLDFDLTNYWYPNATRFIPFTIHEFPIYSFVVSDLHGHVLSIPIVLTIIAVLLHELSQKKIRRGTLILTSFLLATAYMTNAWDGFIYSLLSVLVILYINAIPFFGDNHSEGIKYYVSSIMRNKKYILHSTYYILLILAGFIVFSLPFSLHFSPSQIVSGIGVMCMPSLLTNIGRIGPFLFEANHCMHSPLYMLVILWGFFYFFVFSFLVFIVRPALKNQFLRPTDMFVLILIVLSTVLILTPEFVYAKDIYPAHFRANTMFKLGYQAFIMLSLATGYIIVRLILELKSKFVFKGWFLSFAFLFCLVALYPYFSIMSYYGDLKLYHGLDGIVYLKEQYPQDYEAIVWIREHIKGQPVILEAAGESYTDFARVSANTGLPTVVGWPVHEWLWRGSYDEAGKRVSEVEKLYTTKDVDEAKNLIAKYRIEYVFVGALEKQKYPGLEVEKFTTLGDVIYQKGETVIYQLRNQVL